MSIMNSASKRSACTSRSARVAAPNSAQSRPLELPQVGRVRVDTRRRLRPPRAHVLRAYADWLSHQSSDASQRSRMIPQPVTVESPAPSSPAPSPSAERQAVDANTLYYRIDVAPQAATVSIEGIEPSPHFETRDYVPPAPEAIPSSPVEMPNADSPRKQCSNRGGSPDLAETLSERDRQQVPADGRPAPGVRNHIRELQSRGRLIGDLNATRMLEQARSVPPVQRTVHGKPLTTVRRSPGDRHQDGIRYSSGESHVRQPEGSPAVPVVHDASGLCPAPRWPAVTEALLTNHRQAIETLGREVAEGLVAGHNRIAVTSTRRGEGCTTIALTLARWLASQGQRVLLVDADLTHPDLQSLVSKPFDRTWSKGIEQQITPKSIAHASPDPSIEIVLLGQISDNTGWTRPMLDCLGEWLHAAQTEYDVILINVGPVFQLVAELSHADRLFDTAILVNATNRTTTEERIRSQNGLLSAGAVRLIVAQNFAPGPQLEPSPAG